jgi:flagellar biosynthetic protein FliQ
MTPDEVVSIGVKAIETTALLAGPMLLTALVVGAVIGVVQAATQINEMTLSFVPKLVSLAVILVILGPWFLQILIDFTTELFGSIGRVSG